MDDVCAQSDILCPTQTVEEALMFYARLKLPSTPLEEQKKRVQYLINVLHLDRCRNNPIGDEKKRGISGGEKRRVSIAAEILNDVDIILLSAALFANSIAQHSHSALSMYICQHSLDEPTSGYVMLLPALCATS